MAFIPSMPKKGFNVKCTECAETFHLDHSNLKTKRIKGESHEGLALYEIFYHCTECQHKFVICNIDKYMKDVLGPAMKEYRRLKNNYHFMLLQKKYKKRLDLINKRA